jgi:CubicO group peptidase (beta-lactamase class C family)
MNALKQQPIYGQSVFLLTAVLTIIPVLAAENEPPACPEVTAAMEPYLDSYKLAGVIGIIADKNGEVHYKNLLGYADVEAKKLINENNVFWIASMTKMFAGAGMAQHVPKRDWANQWFQQS